MEKLADSFIEREGILRKPNIPIYVNDSDRGQNRIKFLDQRLRILRATRI